MASGCASGCDDPHRRAVGLATAPIDMRMGTERLLARVVQVFGAAQAHHGYLFANARGNRMKLLLHDGFGALRSAYEAFIIFDLFNQVVMRFEERISFLRLRDIKWDQSIADEIVNKCEHLSGYITGHLHSDMIGAIKPTPDTLLKEIQDFDNLRKKLIESKPLNKK